MESNTWTFAEQLCERLFGDNDFQIDHEGSDLDRIYLTRNGEEFIVRTWNVFETSVSFTLYRTNGEHGGVEVDSGVFKLDRKLGVTERTGEDGFPLDRVVLRSLGIKQQQRIVRGDSK